MRRHLALVIAVSAVAPVCATPAQAESWLFKPSTFSHHPMTGARVNQYAAKKPSYVRTDGTYLESGYRHMRFNIRAGGSADRLHVVQTWGAGEAIRPYGEWQFPFRAGATPYGPWGNPRGPWTMPYDSWVNPYGQWNRYPYLPWGPGSVRPPAPGHGPPAATPYQATPQHPPGYPY